MQRTAAAAGTERLSGPMSGPPGAPHPLPAPIGAPDVPLRPASRPVSAGITVQPPSPQGAAVCYPEGIDAISTAVARSRGPGPARVRPPLRRLGCAGMDAGREGGGVGSQAAASGGPGGRPSPGRPIRVSRWVPAQAGAPRPDSSHRLTIPAVRCGPGSGGATAMDRPPGPVQRRAGRGIGQAWRRARPGGPVP